MSKWYAVKIGKIPGIYSSWDLCRLQTNGFSGSVFKSFKTREDALEYFYDGNVPDEMKKIVPLAARLPFIEIPKVNGVSGGVKLLDLIASKEDLSEVEKYSYGNFTPPKIQGKKYFEADRSILDIKCENLLIVYIDGSKRPSVNHRGSGAYCRFQKKDYFLSVPFAPYVGAKYDIIPDDYDNLSSPTMEYLALGEVLWRFISLRIPEVNSIPQIINPRLKIIFVADYIGVKCWTDGTWSANKDYIKKIFTSCDSILSFLKKKGVDVEIKHCDGHVGILGNELSDVAAKSTTYFDDMFTLVRDLSNSLSTK